MKNAGGKEVKLVRDNNVESVHSSLSRWESLCGGNRVYFNFANKSPCMTGKVDCSMRRRIIRIIVPLIAILIPLWHRYITLVE